MTHHGGGEAAAMAAAASAGAQQAGGGGEAGPPRRRELTAEDIARRDETAKRLAKLDPVGKKIDFEEGVSRATVRYARGTIPFTVPGEHDLAGVSGKVVKAEVGTILGGQLNDPAALILHVYAKGRFFPPRFPHSYVVRDSEAAYTLR